MSFTKKIKSLFQLKPKLIKVLKKKRFSYERIRKESVISLLTDSQYTLNVIIGFRGRPEFYEICIASFNKAFNYYNEKYPKSNYTFCLTFVEHDLQPTAQSIFQGLTNYIWTKGNVTDQYSRSFAYNFGVNYANKARYYLLHDLDILVKENFFEELFLNLGENKCIQPYGKRRLLYLSEELTCTVLKKQADYNTFSENTSGVSLPLNIGSKGGSFLIERELFYQVGGLDPEIFWGYAAEDQFFWEKLLTICGEIPFADNPPIDMIHMWHPPTNKSNLLLSEMEYYFNVFKSMTKPKRLEIIKIQRDSISNARNEK